MVVWLALSGELVGLFRGGSHAMEPEFLYRANGAEILILVRRLYDISGCLQPVGTYLIFRALAAAHHDDRDSLQAGIGLHFLQHFKAIDLRQVKIEEHKIWRRGLCVVARSFEEGDGFLTVRNHGNVAMD